MGDFEPRMDKWGENLFSPLARDAKDAIVNKGRLEREHRRAAKLAVRRARWKRSRLGRILSKIAFLFWLSVAVGIFGFVGFFAWTFLRVAIGAFGS